MLLFNSSLLSVASKKNFRQDSPPGGKKKKLTDGLHLLALVGAWGIPGEFVPCCFVLMWRTTRERWCSGSENQVIHDVLFAALCVAKEYSTEAPFLVFSEDFFAVQRKFAKA